MFSKKYLRPCVLLVICIFLLSFYVAVAQQPDQKGARKAPPQQQQKQRPPVVVPDDVTLMKDVVYGKGGDKELKMDIAMPKVKPSEPLPCIVTIHGGGWTSGSKNESTGEIVNGVKKGYVCASIDYRLSGEAIFPAQIEDCKCAIRYLRAHAKEYGIDPERIGVRGGSAGGHLVALMGTSGGVAEFEGTGGWQDQSSKVQAVADMFGPTDFLRMADFESRIAHNEAGSPESKLIGGPIQENKEKTQKANPINYITPDDPPFLIVHGSEDPLVPVNQSVLLFNALRDAKLKVNMYVVQGAGHGGFGGPEMQPMVYGFFDSVFKNNKTGASAPAAKAETKSAPAASKN